MCKNSISRFYETFFPSNKNRCIHVYIKKNVYMFPNLRFICIFYAFEMMKKQAEFEMWVEFQAIVNSLKFSDKISISEHWLYTTFTFVSFSCFHLYYKTTTLVTEYPDWQLYVQTDSRYRGDECYTDGFELR